MINPKNICISSCIGFFLSLFIGIISPGVGFTNALLRALVFAVVFAVLCVLITCVYQRFLSTDTSNLVSDSESMGQRPAGSVVNIVVDDSDLPDDGLSPKFTVLNSRFNNSDSEEPEVNKRDENKTPPVQHEKISEAVAQPVSDQSSSKIENSSVATPVSEEKEAFKPVNLAESKESNASSKQEDGPFPAATESLDDLPDIGSMSVDSLSMTPSDDSFQSNEVVNDTEFATGGAAIKEQPVSGDTNVMAKAIQTLLAKDNN